MFLPAIEAFAALLESGNQQVEVLFNPNDPMTFIMPEVRQFSYDDQFYIPPFDGPSLIGQFSKDLAFELYTQYVCHITPFKCLANI